MTLHPRPPKIQTPKLVPEVVFVLGKSKWRDGAHGGVLVPEYYLSFTNLPNGYQALQETTPPAVKTCPALTVSTGSRGR